MGKKFKVFAILMVAFVFFASNAFTAPIAGFEFNVNITDTNNDQAVIGGYKVLISTVLGEWDIANALDLRIGSSTTAVKIIPPNTTDVVIASIPQAYVEESFYIGYTAVDITGQRMGPVCQAGSAILPSALSPCPPVTEFIPIY